MKNYIIIIYTQVDTQEQMDQVAHLLNSMISVEEWTADYADDDNVLRIACNKNIGKNIEQRLDTIGVKAKIMAIYCVPELIS